MENVVARLQEIITLYGLKIIVALVILVVGRLVAKWMRNLVVKIMAGRKLDKIVVSFVGNLVYIGLMVFVVLAVLGQLGIQRLPSLRYSAPPAWPSAWPCRALFPTSRPAFC